MRSSLSLSAAACLVLASTSSAESLYGKNSAVLQVTAKTFDSKIKNTYNSSIVEFYAPWCGHCKNLKPAFEKAAKNLEGIAQIAAINCDDDDNKEFCGRMGVKGFPTLKTVRQTGTFGKPIISDYNQGRSASDIVEAAKNLLPNHVMRVTDKDWDSWLAKKNDTAKAILFSDKGTTSALIKSLAHDFYDSIEIAQVRDKETAVNEVFGITNYPTLVVLPGGDQVAIIYDGDLKRPGMLSFLSKYGKVRTPPAKGTKSKSSKKDEKASSAFSKASAAHESAEASSSAATASTVTIEMPEFTESPGPEVEPEATPVPIPVADPVPTFETQEELQTKCLGAKTNTCVLALLPTQEDTDCIAALASLASLKDKHIKEGTTLFPFFSVPAANPASALIKTALSLEGTDKPQIIAVNSKRSWWRQLDSSKGFDVQAVEDWIDGIRFGESKKNKLPEGILVDALAAETSTTTTEAEATTAESDTEAETSTVAHGEL